jgi:hypothetical protein
MPIADVTDGGPDAGASCTFALPMPSQYPNDRHDIRVHLGEFEVPEPGLDQRDRWTYTDGSGVAIELLGSPCDDLHAGDGPLCVVFQENIN